LPLRPDGITLASVAVVREEAMISLVVNGELHKVQAGPEAPLLWVLRDSLGLVGTKYGCGRALCG